MNYLVSLSGVILVLSGTLHYCDSVEYFSTSWITWVCASSVSSSIVPILIFDVYTFLGAPVETLLGRIFKLGFELGSPVGFNMDMNP